MAGSLVAHRKADREIPVPRVAAEGIDGRSGIEQDDAAVVEFEKTALIGYVLIRLTIKGYVWHRYNPRRIDPGHLKTLKASMSHQIDRFTEPVAAFIRRSDIAEGVEPVPTSQYGDDTPVLELKSKDAKVVMLSGQHRARVLDEFIAEEREELGKDQLAQERLMKKRKVKAGEEGVIDFSTRIEWRLSKLSSMQLWLCALYDPGKHHPASIIHHFPSPHLTLPRRSTGR